MLTGTDGIELIEVYQEIVRQRHLLIELVRKVEVVEVVLTQLERKESTHKSGLSAALRSDQSGHAFIAMERIHLQPMGHNGSNPGGQKAVMLCAEAWDSTEEISHMVLTIPLREMAQKVLSGGYSEPLG